MVPCRIAVAHPTLFTAADIEEFEKRIIFNTAATEREASDLFSDMPKFLFLGEGLEVRREVILYGPDNRPRGRVDFFRRTSGSRFWDIIELKGPSQNVVVSEQTQHPRLTSVVGEAITQIRA